VPVIKQISFIAEQLPTNHWQLKKTWPILDHLNQILLLHYFRINDPYRVIGLLIVLLLLYLPVLIDVAPITYPELKTMIVGDKLLNGSALYTEIIDSTPPFTGWFFAVINWVFGDSLALKHILAFIILFLEAVVLGLIFIDKKAFPDSSFIPSLIFGILCVFSFDTISLSGELVGTFFLLMALNSLFREIEFREENFEMVLKTGLFIGIGSLFEFSFSVYVVAVLIILILFTRTSGRKIFLLFTGYMLPHLFLISIYSIKGGVDLLWEYFYLPNLGFGGDTFVTTGSLMVLLAIPALFFAASLILLNRESRFTKYQSQLLQAMFFWTIFSVLQVFYSKALRPHCFIPAMIGFSFFISHFFLIVARKRFAELAFWIFLLGIVSVAYYYRYSRPNEETYRNLLVEKTNHPELTGKKVVVLADSLELYNGTSMTTPFLNWRLSEDIFLNPEYYDNINLVYQGFLEKPDIVIDPKNLLRPFIETIPSLRSQYARSPMGYERIEIISN
jgi:hypothetical protein